MRTIKRQITAHIKTIMDIRTAVDGKCDTITNEKTYK